jgi:hypothetical protein
MQKEKKEETLFKPIILLLLQSVALFNIFDLLSTKEFFTNFETISLATSLGFIMLSSLFTFGILDKLREQENKKQQKATS